MRRYWPTPQVAIETIEVPSSPWRVVVEFVGAQQREFAFYGSTAATALENARIGNAEMNRLRSARGVQERQRVQRWNGQTWQDV